MDPEVLKRILDYADWQCAPVAETVAAELDRIAETKREREGLRDYYRHEMQRHENAMRLIFGGPTPHDVDALLHRLKLETERHQFTIGSIIDRGVTMQGACRHWHVKRLEGVTREVGHYIYPDSYECTICGKTW